MLASQQENKKQSDQPLKSMATMLALQQENRKQIEQPLEYGHSASITRS